MRLLRTPDAAFRDLPDHPFDAHHLDVGPVDGMPTVRMGYVDEGPRDGAPVVMLHGVPAWSYEFRHVVPVLARSGLRVIAPDLVGFGRSDKPAEVGDHSIGRHVRWVLGLLDGLGVAGFSLVASGWGGIVGLRIVAAVPDRVQRVALIGTALPTGDRHPGGAFLAWQRYVTEATELRIGTIVDFRCSRTLTPEERAAYDAPFPDEHHKAGPRAAPLLVPTQPHDPATLAHREAWEVLRAFERPVLRANGDGDPLAPWTEEIGAAIPGAASWPHVTIEHASHVVAEDRPGELAQVLVDFLTPGASGVPGEAAEA